MTPVSFTIAHALPEVILAVSILVLLLVGALRGERSAGFIAELAIGVLALVTVVILMGFGRRVELAQHLLSAGWDASTPAAIVAEGTLPSETAWRGSLADITDHRAGLETDGPAIIVIGSVAGLELNGRRLTALNAAAIQDDDAARTVRGQR